MGIGGCSWISFGCVVGEFWCFGEADVVVGLVLVRNSLIFSSE